MVLAITDSNECNFGIKFEDESKLELVKYVAQLGLYAWYQAAHEDKANPHFTEDEIDGFYWSGYAEPTSELLDRYGIKHEIVDYDENSDEVFYC